MRENAITCAVALKGVRSSAVLLLTIATLLFTYADPSRGDARDLGSRYPVSAEVTQVLAGLRNLMTESAARDVLEREQKTWLANREAHCYAMSKLQGIRPDDSKQAWIEIENCFVAADKQRADNLRETKLALLLELSAIAPSKDLQARPSIPFERGQIPNDLRVSPDGRLIVIGKIGGDIDVIDAKTGQILRLIRTGRYGYISNMQFSANGRLLFVSSSQNRGLKIYDPYTGDILREYDGVMGPFALLSDSRHVVYADRSMLKVYNVITNKAFETPFSQRAYILKIVVSPDAKRVAVMSSDRQLTLWDVTHSRDIGATLSKVAEAYTDRFGDATSYVAFTRTGELLLTATTGGTLTRWSVPELKRRDTIQIGPSVGLYRLPDTNQIVVPGTKGGQVDRLLFWDLDRDYAAVAPLTGVGNGVRVAAAKDARFVYVTSVAGLSVVDNPSPEAYKSSTTVLAPLLDDQGRERTAMVAKIPMLRGVAQDAAVEAIGVYQGRSPPGIPSPGYHAGRDVRRPVDIFIGKTDRSFVLVLSSSAPVEWRLTQSEGAKLKHILLSGSNESTVTGEIGAEITRIAIGSVHGVNDERYASFQDGVRQYIGKGIDRFQGAYTAGEFSIGIVPQRARGPDAVTYRCSDAAGRISYLDRPCSQVGLQDGGSVARPSNVSPYELPGGPNHSGRTVTIKPLPHERVIRCGGTTIVCDAQDTVICGGKQVPCR